MSLLADQLRTADLRERRERLTDLLRRELARLLGFDSPEDVGVDESFADLGAVSSQAVGFAVLLDRLLGLRLGTSVLFEHPTVGRLAGHLAERIGVESAALGNSRSEALPDKPVPVAAPAPGQAVAVLGMGCLFPGISDPDSFWRRSQDGAVLDLTGSGPEFGRVGEELRAADRSACLAIRAVAQILQATGAGPGRWAGREVGVFLNASAPVGPAAYEIPVANRVSFEFDLCGPSETYYAYCAGVFAALHRALAAIRGGECRWALVGGVNTINAEEFQGAARSGAYAGLLSPRNRMRSFSRRADGFVRSEGVGVLLLGPLSAADGLPLQALVRGTAVRHNGRGYSLEAPDPTGIADTARRCLRASDTAPETVSYLEAHGVGRAEADALELAALHRVYGASRSRLSVGCVKPLIGHPEAAAGAAALIRAVLALTHRALPPLPDAGEPLEDLPDGHRFEFRSQPGQWTVAGPRRVALNSYGMGGLNGHVILEEPPASVSPEWVGDGSTATRLVRSRPPEPAEHPQMAPPAADIVREVVGRLLGLDPRAVPLELPPARAGLDSRHALELLAGINARLGTEVRFSQLMTAETLAEFSEVVQTAPRRSSETPARSDLADEYPLSETQRGMWYLGRLLDRGTGFHVPVLMDLDEPLDLGRFGRALAAALAAHPALRVRFVPGPDGELHQRVIAAPDVVSLPVWELADTPADAGQPDTPADAGQPDEEPLGERLLGELRRPFDLERELLVRAVLVRCGRRESLLLVAHHIVIDGLSAVALMNEVWNRYRQVPGSDLAPAPNADTALFDYITWEREYLASPEAEADRQFWRESLSGVPTRIDLPDDGHHVGPDIEGVGCESGEISGAELARLRAVAAELAASPATVMLTAFFVLLQRFSGQGDLAVTTPVAGRPEARFRAGIGCFINLIVTRFRGAARDRFADAVRQVRTALAAGIDHGRFPYARLPGVLGLQLAGPAAAMFPISFTYQDIFDGWDGGFRMADCATLRTDLYQEVDDDLTLEVYDLRGSLRVNFKFQRRRFLPATVRRFLDSYLVLLHQAVAEPARALSELEVFTAPQRAELAELAAGPAVADCGTEDLWDLFDRQVQERPDAPAVRDRSVPSHASWLVSPHVCSTDGSRWLTYGGLCRSAKELAARLLQLGVRPGDVVGVGMPRGIEQATALLGILRCGATYLPIDPGAPGERTAAMLARTGAVGTLRAGLEFAAAGTSSRRSFRQLGRPSLGKQDADPAAYVLFTSGTTGEPKGVAIGRRALTHLCRSMQRAYGLAPGDRVLQFAPLTFDMSVEEIFPALTAGAEVVFRDEEDLQPERFARLVVESAVTVVNLPPSFHEVLRTLGEERLRSLYRRMRVVSFGGDRLPPATLRFFGGLPVRVFNAYGPTECCVNATLAELTDSTHSGDVHIGRPLPGVTVQILDEGLGCVPRGIPGELCIGGVGVAAGYTDRPAETANAFVAVEGESRRLYRTGDRARWRPDGNLELLGRLDEQLSIRGFRVEPAEVEAALTAVPGVLQAAVVGQQDGAGQTQLVAYYVAESPIGPQECRAGLRMRLPGYLVPSIICRVDDLPLTPNGKVDRGQLARRRLDPTEPAQYVAPVDATQELVAEVFCRVLGRERVGLRDNFFDLGGHSLAAIRIVAELARLGSGAELRLQEFYACRDVEDVAARLMSARATPAETRQELTNFEEGRHDLVL